MCSFLSDGLVDGGESGGVVAPYLDEAGEFLVILLDKFSE